VNTRSIAALAGLAGLLSACSSVCPTDSDPSGGGFVGGACGLSTGSYDQRIENRQERLAAVKGESEEQEAETQALINQANARDAEAAQLRQKVAATRQETRRLQQQVAAKSNKSDAMRAEEAEIRKQIAEVEAELDALEARNAKAEELRTALKELEELNQRLAAMSRL